jgi:hypothetical protein
MAAGEITPDEALTVTRVLDSRRRALQAVVLEHRLAAETEEMAEAAAEAMAPAGDAAPHPDNAGDAAADRGDTPNGCDSTEVPLHFACNSSSPATIRGIVAALPVAERRLLAAIIRQRRIDAAVTAPPM